jgi:hypothetical protein
MSSTGGSERLSHGEEMFGLGAELCVLMIEGAPG